MQQMQTENPLTHNPLVDRTKASDAVSMPEKKWWQFWRSNLKSEKVVDSQEVIFLREETRQVLESTATYHYYKASSKAASLDFLNKQRVSLPMFILAVESPEGRWIKDVDGISEM